MRRTTTATAASSSTSCARSSPADACAITRQAPARPAAGGRAGGMLRGVTERQPSSPSGRRLPLGPERPDHYADPSTCQHAPSATRQGLGVTDRRRHAFGGNALLPSWNARTPAGTWLISRTRSPRRAGALDAVSSSRAGPGRPPGGVAGAHDGNRQVLGAAVAADAGSPRPARLDAGRSRHRRLRRPARRGQRRVSLVAGAASASRSAPTSRRARLGRRGHEMTVPPHSQRLHVGTFPEWDNGGQTWCSPTSTTMLLETGVLRRPRRRRGSATTSTPRSSTACAASRPGLRRRRNWAFNTAYAGVPGCAPT